MKNPIASLRFRAEKYKCQQVVKKHIARGLPQVYHYHVMKTGGTSINKAFIGLNKNWEAPALFDYIRNNHKNNPEMYYRGDDFVVAHGRGMLSWKLFTFGFSHIPKWQLTMPSDIYTFTCLRDPYKRLFSRYKHLKTMYLGPYQAQFERDQARFVPWLKGDFLHFVEAAAQESKEELLNTLYIFSERCEAKEAFTSACEVNDFFFLENLDVGIQHLKAQTGLPIEVRHDNKSGYKEDVPASVREAIKSEYLKEEYLFFEMMQEEYERRYGERAF